MTGRHRAPAVALLGAVTAAGLAAGPPAAPATAAPAAGAPATAAPATGAPADCGADGVRVVVDPGPLGGRPQAGCAEEGGGRTAAEIIERAGFEIEYAAGQPFICRVDGIPVRDQDPCLRTPPADAYWGLFWSGQPTGGWTYSTLGVASLEVPAGGAVGLRFQDGGEREEPRPAPVVEEPGPAAGDRNQPQGSEGAADGTEAADQQPLALVAGAAALLLAAAAGAVAWRRRG